MKPGAVRIHMSACAGPGAHPDRAGAGRLKAESYLAAWTEVT